MGIELTDEQLYAVMDLEHWHQRGDRQVFEVSGGPGTGKTTMILYVIERLGLKLDQVLFCAYMGKAVNQMVRNGLPAKTIHSSIYNYERVEVYDENGEHVRNVNGTYKTKGVFRLKHKLPKRYKLIVVDEGGMVPVDIGEDLLSFGLPVIVMGDLNQLPPVFGKPFFLQHPNVVLHKIMRQKEGDPIIYLANEILHGRRLRPGVYGKSAVITRNEINDFIFQNASVVLTDRNAIRSSVNRYYREYIHGIRKLDRPHVGEKVINRKNNKDLYLGDGIYLMNGIAGTLESIDMSSFNGKTLKVNFRPDFTKQMFMSVPISYMHLTEQDQYLSEKELYYDSFQNRMEYAYCITVHLSQGSQYENVVYLEDDGGGWDSDLRRSLHYVAVTRATESVVYVLNH